MNSLYTESKKDKKRESGKKRQPGKKEDKRKEEEGGEIKAARF